MNILRSIVSSPTTSHDDKELGLRLDLAYVTSSIIVASGPVNSCEFPKILYRYPISDLVSFLNHYHGSSWCLFNFRAEDSGYNDSDVNDKVNHFPFPDHQPPPFHFIPQIVKSIDSFLSDGENVAILHCKAGKGRSGSMACAYLMYKDGLSVAQSIELFTSKRMRNGFGDGVSILSQVRYLHYWSTFINKSNEINYFALRNVYLSKIIITNPYYDIYLQLEEYINGSDLNRVYGMQNEHVNKEGNLLLISPKKVKLSNDLKISFNELKSSYLIRDSFAYIWFNLLFETINSNSDVNFKKLKQFKNITGSYKANWEELDGLKGTFTRGLKLFDSIEILWYFES